MIRVDPRESAASPLLGLFLSSIVPSEPKGGLDLHGTATENAAMEIRGRVHNGVVVLEGELPLPEGAVVTVSYPVPSRAGPPDSRRRVRLPLVPSDRPGSRPLTAERVAELLEDEDVSG